MAENEIPCAGPKRRPIRWWPAILILVATVAAILWVRAQGDWPYQKRNLTTAPMVVVTAFLLLVWWLLLSRTRMRLRLGAVGGVVVLGMAGAALFRFRGVSGDLAPILEFRWAKPVLNAAPALAANPPNITTAAAADSSTSPFPQYLGPDRTGVIPGPRFETNWITHPPVVVWRQHVGAAWSGFVIVGELCLTLEQRGEDECVVAYDLATGRQVWLHADKTRYDTAIAGEGPRTTPTVAGHRVLACGATGILNCFELATGRQLWTRNIVKESGGRVPEWGVAGSPLVVDGLVIVHGSGGEGRSLLALRLEDGQPAWSAGAASASYASPVLATLAGVPQVLAFNHQLVSGHDPATGATLWKHPWKSGNVVCSTPAVAGRNRVVFSSGYGYGAELLEISHSDSGNLSVQRVWKSPRMKSKFGHIFARDGFLYGLDDGVFACVDLKDGAQRWKEGRHGHGQGLLVGDLYLLMAESGELILLRPTPEGPNEQAHLKVFNGKTWNPIALAGDRLLVRNDREAACLRLAVAP